MASWLTATDIGRALRLPGHACDPQNTHFDAILRGAEHEAPVPRPIAELDGSANSSAETAVGAAAVAPGLPRLSHAAFFVLGRWAAENNAGRQGQS
jgi:hypothetical protein